jgi:hypothetical protein
LQRWKRRYAHEYSSRNHGCCRCSACCRRHIRVCCREQRAHEHAGLLFQPRRELRSSGQPRGSAPRAFRRGYRHPHKHECRDWRDEYDWRVYARPGQIGAGGQRFRDERWCEHDRRNGNSWHRKRGYRGRWHWGRWRHDFQWRNNGGYPGNQLERIVRSERSGIAWAGPVCHGIGAGTARTGADPDNRRHFVRHDQQHVERHGHGYYGRRRDLWSDFRQQRVRHRGCCRNRGRRLRRRRRPRALGRDSPSSAADQPAASSGAAGVRTRTASARMCVLHSRE